MVDSRTTVARPVKVYLAHGPKIGKLSICPCSISISLYENYSANNVPNGNGEHTIVLHRRIYEIKNMGVPWRGWFCERRGVRYDRGRNLSENKHQARKVPVTEGYHGRKVRYVYVYAQGAR